MLRDRGRSICGAFRRRVVVRGALAVIATVFAAECGANTASVKSPVAAAPASSPPANAVAVLPLTYVGGATPRNWFIDGISRELIEAVGHDPALQVTAWNSASRHDAREPAAAIGHALHVATFVRGTLAASSDPAADAQTVMFLQLVDAGSGHVIWSQSYGAPLSQIPRTENEIAMAVAKAMRVPPAPVVHPQALDVKAHALVLAGQAWLRTARSLAQVRHAQAMFRSALARDARYAEGHAALADSWMAIAMHSGFGALRRASALADAEAEARLALALDPDNVDALDALANAKSRGQGADRGRALYARVLAIDPSNANARIGLADALASSDPDVVAQLSAAAQVDPDNRIAQNNLAELELDRGEYAAALPHSQAAARLAQGSVDAALLLALNDALLHRDHDAVSVFAHRGRSEFDAQLLAAARLAYQSSIDPQVHARAVAAAARLNAWTSIGPEALGDLLQVEVKLGEDAKAVAGLARLCSASALACSDLGSFPAWLPLHGNPEFVALVRRYDPGSQLHASAAR